MKLRPIILLALGGTLLAFSSCSDSKSTTYDTPESYASDIAVPTSAAAQAEAEDTITSANFESEFERLRRDIEEESSGGN